MLVPVALMAVYFTEKRDGNANSENKSGKFIRKQGFINYREMSKANKDGNYHCLRVLFRTINKSLPIYAKGIIKDELAFKHFDLGQHLNSFLKQTTSK